GVNVPHPLGRKVGSACASPGHHAADVFTVFTEEHVGESGHTGILDIPPHHLFVEANRLIHVIGYEFVPDEAVCHFAPSICDISLRSKHRSHTLSLKSGCCPQAFLPRYTLL